MPLNFDFNDFLKISKQKADAYTHRLKKKGQGNGHLGFVA